MIAPGGSCRGGRQWRAVTNQRIALSAERASTLHWTNSIGSLQVISRIGEHLFAARSRKGDVGSAPALNSCAESVKAYRIQRSSFRIAREGHLLTVTGFLHLEMNTDRSAAVIRCY